MEEFPYQSIDWEQRAWAKRHGIETPIDKIFEKARRDKQLARELCLRVLELAKQDATLSNLLIEHAKLNRKGNRRGARPTDKATLGRLATLYCQIRARGHSREDALEDLSRLFNKSPGRLGNMLTEARKVLADLPPASVACYGLTEFLQRRE
jgi:hypothetical protein